MSVLELKGSITELIFQIHNERKLTYLQRIVERIAVDDVEIEDLETIDYILTADQEIELEEAISETKNPALWIDHNDMKNRHAKWLRK
jgi:pectate lyase